MENNPDKEENNSSNKQIKSVEIISESQKSKDEDPTEVKDVGSKVPPIKEELTQQGKTSQGNSTPEKDYAVKKEIEKPTNESNEEDDKEDTNDQADKVSLKKSAAEDSVPEDKAVVDTKAKDTVTDDAKAKDTVSDDAKAEDTVAGDAKAEDTVADDAKAKDTVSDDAKAEDTVADDAKVEDATTDGTVADDVVADDTATEESVAEDSITEDKVPEDENGLEHDDTVMEVEEVAQNGLKNDNESSSKEKLFPVGEKRKRTRTSTTEKRTNSQTPVAVETRQKSKRPKRNAASPFDKLDVELTPVVPTPRIKRNSTTPVASRHSKRTSNSPSVTDPGETKPFLCKGNVLAVRNEEGGFYLCLVRSNIYSIVKPFKIQWLDNTEKSDVYTRSYGDFLNYNSVLVSDVVVKKLDNMQLQLPETQKRKIEHRLKKSLCGSLIDSSSSSESDEVLLSVEKKKRKTLQKTSDSNDASSSSAPPTTAHKSNKQIKAQNTNQKRKSMKSMVAFTSVPPPSSRGRRRTLPPPARNVTSGRPTQRGRPPKNQLTEVSGDVDEDDEIIEFHLQLVGAHIKSSEASIGAVKYMINPEVFEQMKADTQRSNEELTPNESINVITEDPCFGPVETAHLPKSKLAIHATIQQNLEALKKVFSLSDDTCKLFCSTRSIDVPLTAIHYALLGKSESMLVYLLQQLSTLGDFNMKEALDGYPSILRGSTDTQNGFKGEELTPLDISKGLKEGNFAFLKNCKPKFSSARELASNIASFVCEKGIEPSMLDVLYENYPSGSDFDFKEFLFEFYYKALDMGHNKVAHYIVKQSRQLAATYPKPEVNPHLTSTLSYFNTSAQSLTELHENSLIGGDTDLAPYTLKDLKKRTSDGHRYQPVHCAAINPDPTTLKRIVKIARECSSTLDGRSRRPVHYAAACSNPEGLMHIKNLVAVEEQDTNGMTPLMVAAEAGRYESVDLLLGVKEVSVDRPDRFNRSAIHLAASNGHTDVVVSLIQAKADVNKQLSISKARATPLMLAAACGHVETCKKLVELGAGIELRDKLHRTALIHAAMNGHYPIVAFLLNRGADPCSSDSSNNSAIHYAAAYGWYHCVAVLLQAKAQPHAENDRKMPPIGVAILKDHRDVADLLSSHGANPNYSDERGRTLFARLLSEEPLSWKLVDKLTYLLSKYEPDVNAQDVQGMTPLHYLTQNTIRDPTSNEVDAQMQEVSLHLAKLLVDAGAGVNITDYRGRVPLYFAVQDMNVKVMKLLVTQNSVCPRSASATSDTILHTIARNWNSEEMAGIVLQLVNSSAAVVHKLSTRRNKFGFTPLLLLAKSIADSEASLYSDEDEDRERVKQQFQYNLQNFACPLLDAFVSAAKSNVSTAVGKTKRNYRSHSDEGKTAAHYLAMATVDTGCKTLLCLLQHSPKLDLFDEFGATALIQSIVSRNCQATEVLLDAGACPNLCTQQISHKYPCAPLILAVDNHGPGPLSLLRAIRALLRKIPDIQEVPPDPRNGRTALMSAVEKEEELDLVKALLEKQASLEGEDHQGHTPLHLAVNASGPTSALFDIPNLLIDKGASLVATDRSGRIPLHYAFSKIQQSDDESGICYDPIELTTLLTSNIAGSKIDSADEKGRTPLHEAARRGAMICCIHLVKSGADINKQDLHGNTPLSLAVKSGHNSCAVMLIQNNANVNTNVISHLDPAAFERDNSATRWRLRSTVTPVPKSTCETVFKVVVEKGWQGVTYVMLDRLESCGVKYAAAVEAAMRARNYQVVLSLLRKQRDSNKLCEKNELKQNLLHILSINRPRHTEVQIKVANVLIDRGVTSYTTDDYGCTPLHYAAFTKNFHLIQFFAERDPQTFHNMIALVDFNGRNAISALMWNSIINDDESVKIFKLFLEQDRSSSVINRFCKFPVLDFDCKLSVIHNERSSAYGGDVDEPAVLVRDYFHGKADCSLINPLIRAIQLRAHKVIDLLLDHNVDINTQVDGIGKQTPLMIAVQQNDEHVVKKLLTHKTPVLLSSLDDNGRTVIHHAAKPLPYGYWENITILRLLMTQGGVMPLSQADEFGKTALDYALEGGSGRMSNELQEALNISVEKRRKPSARNELFTTALQWENPAPDCDNDAITILERIREDEGEQQQSVALISPDMLSGLREGGEIVVDPQTNRHCDVFLTSVDVQTSDKVHYNFFRMQVIHQKGKDLFMFFMRWGVIGERGTWQTSPFNTATNAIKEFAKYFKLKTANEWRSVNGFKPQTRKYHLVPADAQRHRIVSELDFDLVTDVESCIDERVQNVYTDLINIDSMKRAMRESTNVDPEVVPFGRLDCERLNTSIELLSEIKALLNYCDDLRSSDPQDLIKLQKTLEKIQQKSTEYYRILPPRGGIFDRVSPINDAKTLSRLLVQNNRLVELEFANKVLLGAQYRINDMNAVDYVYRSVGCNVQAMVPNNIESQYLLQCIHNTGGDDVRVDCIYRISRSNEESELNSLGFGNHRMLWYGTNIISLLSTLNRGLQPIESNCKDNCDQYAKGIHLSDMVAHALQECKQWGLEKRYMLLCQVALGKTKEVRDGVAMKANENEVYNSVKMIGKFVPKSGYELILPEGGAIALGEKSLNNNPQTAVSKYNEYVVYSPDQVCLRYLVRFDVDSSSSVDDVTKSDEK